MAKRSADDQFDRIHLTTAFRKGVREGRRLERETVRAARTALVNATATAEQIAVLAASMTTVLVRLHEDGVLSEGQVAKATGLDRISVRKLADDCRNARPAGAPAEPVHSEWSGWDQSNLPWSQAKHQDAVCAAIFGPTWAMEDAAALIGFINKTWRTSNEPNGATMIDRDLVDRAVAVLANYDAFVTRRAEYSPTARLVESDAHGDEALKVLRAIVGANNPAESPLPEANETSRVSLLVLLMQSLRRIAALRDSEAGEPFDEALDIADAAIAANAAHLSAAVADAVAHASAPKFSGGEHG